MGVYSGTRVTEFRYLYSGNRVNIFSPPMNQMLTWGSFRISREELRSLIVEKGTGSYRRSGKSEKRVIHKL